MAIPTIKGTYSLDEETVRALERTARRWNTSKSEVARRAILAVARGDLPVDVSPGPTEALDALQASLALDSDEANAWIDDVPAERHASRSETP